MKTLIAKSFLTCLAAGCLFLAPALSLQAKTVKFPADDPAFSFNLPDGWTTETGKDGRLYCTAGDGSEFKIGFVASPGVKNADDAKELLPKILKGMSDAMKCENYKASEVKTGKMGALSLIAHGRALHGGRHRDVVERRGLFAHSRPLFFDCRRREQGGRQSA